MSKPAPAPAAETPKHPNDVVYAKHPLNADPQYWGGPLDRDYFIIWARWFSLIFRTDVSDTQALSVFISLQGKGITNREFNFACIEIENSNRAWPYVRDFIAAVKQVRDDANDKPDKRY